MKSVQHPSLRTLAFAGVVAVLTLVLLYWLLPLLLPFLLSLALAALIDRPVNMLQRRFGLPRGAAVVGVLVTVIALGTALLAFIVGNLVLEIEALLRRLPEHAESWQIWFDDLLLRTENLIARLPQPLNDMHAYAVDGASQFLANLASALLNQIQRIPNFFFAMLVATITTYFLSRDQRGIANFLLQFLPSHWRARFLEMRGHMVTGLLGLVKAQAILVLITTVSTTAALLLFGVRYAWLLGMAAGLLDLMPVIGPGGVYLPVIVHAVVVGRLDRAVGLAAFWLALIVARQLLEPKIMQSQVGLHPVSMLLALYLGVQLLGVNGLWLGPCVAICLKAAYTVTYRPMTPR